MQAADVLAPAFTDDFSVLYHDCSPPLECIQTLSVARLLPIVVVAVGGVKVVVVLSFIETHEEAAAVILIYGSPWNSMLKKGEYVFIGVIIIFIHYEVFARRVCAWQVALRLKRSVSFPEGLLQGPVCR